MPLQSFHRISDPSGSPEKAKTEVEAELRNEAQKFLYLLGKNSGRKVQPHFELVDTIFGVHVLHVFFTVEEAPRDCPLF